MTQRELHVTIDITDDMWRSRSRLTQRNVENLMRYHASLGITRVYWLVVPELRGTAIALTDGGDGFEAFRQVVDAAHTAGLEIVPILKPLETRTLAQTAPNVLRTSQDLATRKTMIGDNRDVKTFLQAHPELRIQRRQTTGWRDKAVKTIKLVSANSAESTLTAADLAVWTSTVNGDFERYSGELEFSVRLEERAGKQVRVLVLDGLGIAAERRYVLVTCAKRDDKGSFGNRASRLLELYDSTGRPIPVTRDQGVCPKHRLQQRIQRLWLYATGKWGVPEGGGVPDGYGGAPETSAFSFNAGNSDGMRYLDAANSKHGFIAVAKGKAECMDALQPLHPEVRAYWLEQVRRLVDTGADGVDLRICNHSTWMDEPEEFGFGQVAVDACRERGVDITAETFDRAVWKRVQGDAYTEFLREARALTRSRGVKLLHHVNATMGVKIPYWTKNNSPVSIEWQWDRWIREDLCDGVNLKLLPWIWGSQKGAGAEFAEQVAALAKQHGKKVYWEWRFDAHWLISRPGQSWLLGPDRIKHVVERHKWGWNRPDIDAVILYESFDFTCLDPADGAVYGSQAFEAILDAVRNGTEAGLATQKFKTQALPR